MTRTTLENLLAGAAPVIEQLVARTVREALAAAPARDGRDGLPGVAGPPGLPGAPGADGARGTDGKDGAPGRDGTLEGVRFECEGRTVTVRRADGTAIGQWTMPMVLDRGFYDKAVAYEPGDAVTYAGSLWICQTATGARPAMGEVAWRLAVKRGEPGKTGDRGERGPAGTRGEQGLPGVRY